MRTLVLYTALGIAVAVERFEVAGAVHEVLGAKCYVLPAKRAAPSTASVTSARIRCRPRAPRGGGGCSRTIR